MKKDSKKQSNPSKWATFWGKAGEYYVRGLIVSFVLFLSWYLIQRLLQFLNGLEADPRYLGVALILVFLLPLPLGWLQYRILRARLSRMRSGRAMSRMEDRLVAELSLDQRRGYPVVLIDYPNKSIRSLGLMTATVVGTDQSSEYAVVFLPKGPGHGLKGQLLTLKLDELEFTDWSVQNLLQHLLTYGGTTPSRFNEKQSYETK